jgi:hypothetical protein
VQYPVEDIVGFIKYWGFNAVRLPISLPMALNFGEYMWRWLTRSTVAAHSWLHRGTRYGSGTRRDSKNAQDFLAVIRALGRQVWVSVCVVKLAWYSLVPTWVAAALCFFCLGYPGDAGHAPTL